MESTLQALRVLEQRHNGRIPAEALDRVMGRESAAIRKARSHLRHYENELSQVLTAKAQWDAEHQAGLHVDMDEDTYQEWEERFKAQQGYAQAQIDRWRAYLIKLLPPMELVAAE